MLCLLKALTSLHGAHTGSPQTLRHCLTAADDHPGNHKAKMPHVKVHLQKPPTPHLLPPKVPGNIQTCAADALWRNAHSCISKSRSSGSRESIRRLRGSHKHTNTRGPHLRSPKQPQHRHTASSNSLSAISGTLTPNSAPQRRLQRLCLKGHMTLVCPDWFITTLSLPHN
jgi:hypothetical protein